MKDWGEFELEKKGRDWRLSAKGGPAIAIALLVLLLAVHRFLI